MSIEPYNEADLKSYFAVSLSDSEAEFDKRWKTRDPLYQMYAGRTLNDNERRYLAAQQRPEIEFNYVNGVINTIIGAHLADRKEVIFKGDNQDLIAATKGGWMTQLARKAMNLCDGHRQLSDCLLDDLICGYAFAEVYIDTAMFPPRVMLREVMPNEVLPDPDAKEDGLTDATYFIRKRRWIMDEVYARFPDKVEDVRGAVALGHIRPLGTGRKNRSSEVSGRTQVEIYEFQYRRITARVAWVDPLTGNLRNASQKEFNEIKAEAEANAESEVDFGETRYQGYTYYRAFLIGGGGGYVVLDHDQSPIDGFTIIAATNLKDKSLKKGRIEFFGTAQELYSAQRYLNKVATTWITILDLGAKGGGWYDPSALPEGVDEEKWVKNQSIPGMWSPVRAEMMQQGAVKERGVVSPPTGFVDAFNWMTRQISQISGISDYVKGTATQERSAVLISNLQSQSMRMLGPTMDPFTSFIMRTGVSLVNMMIKHMSIDELDKMLGYPEVEGITHVKDPNTDELIPIPTGEYEEDGETPINATAGWILKQEDPIDYEVSVDVGAASPTERQQIWELFQQGVIQVMQQSGVPMNHLIPMLLRNLPLPGAQAKELADKVATEMEEQKQMQTQDGIVQALFALPPEVQAQIAQQLIQAIQQTPPPDEGGGISGEDPGFMQ